LNNNDPGCNPGLNKQKFFHRRGAETQGGFPLRLRASAVIVFPLEPLEPMEPIELNPQPVDERANDFVHSGFKFHIT